MAGARRGPKKLDEIADPVLRRIFQVMPRWGTSQRALCRELAISPYQFSHNRVKGVPITLRILTQVALLSGARVAWLQTGEAPIYEAAGERVRVYPEALQEVLQLMRGKSDAAVEALVRVARLLVVDHPDIIRDVNRASHGIELQNRAAGTLNDVTPEPPG